MIIYHNPRCRKSRETLQRIEAAGIQPTVIKYLETPPDRDTLIGLLKKLNIKAANLIRKTEFIYKTHYKQKSLSEEEWIDAMLTYPKLIERPIVVKEEQAIIGRPPENVDALLGT